MEQPAAFGLTEGDYPYEGRVIGIDPKIDPQTRLISVRAEVENPEGDLRPGQFVRVRVALPAVEEVIALPQTAVVTSLYGDYVYVVEEQTAEPAATDAATEAQTAADGESEGPAENENGEVAEAPPPGVLAEPDGPQLVAKQVFVTIGRRQGNLVEIAEGLEPGQTVVTSGQNKLANNAPVTINNSVDPAALALDGGN
jgi:membrane fusion protein (multidrug efflux system)